MPRLPFRVRRDIYELARSGVPPKRIARGVGCCLDTVLKVANGPEPEEDESAAERCGGCGAKLTVFPCLYCRMLNDGEIKIEVRRANGHLIEFVKRNKEVG